MLPPWINQQQHGPFGQSFGSLVQAFMNQTQKWDGSVDSAVDLLAGTTTLPSKLLIEITHLPIPLTIGLWLETIPRALGDPLPGVNPLWQIQFGSGKSVTQKALFNGVYTFPGADFRVTNVQMNVVGFAISFRAFAFWATAPISLLPGGEI